MEGTLLWLSAKVMHFVCLWGGGPPQMSSVASFILGRPPPAPQPWDLLHPFPRTTFGFFLPGSKSSPFPKIYPAPSPLQHVMFHFNEPGWEWILNVEGQRSTLQERNTLKNNPSDSNWPDFFGGSSSFGKGWPVVLAFRTWRYGENIFHSLCLWPLVQSNWRNESPNNSFKAFFQNRVSFSMVFSIWRVGEVFERWASPQTDHSLTK